VSTYLIYLVQHQPLLWGGLNGHGNQGGICWFVKGPEPKESRDTGDWTSLRKVVVWVLENKRRPVRNEASTTDSSRTARRCHFHTLCYVQTPSPNNGLKHTLPTKCI
jgi:hypothetical protein